jgi:D-alanyl-D-alanine dipeptidase
MEFQTSGSRRQFLSAVARTAGSAITLRSRLGWAVDMTDPWVADIVGKTIGIDTHNHIDVPLTATEMPGPDIDLSAEMKRSGLAAICMTIATDYQPGAAYDRFLKGLASMDRQLERNGMKRSLTVDAIRTAHQNGRPTVIQAVEGAHFLQGHLERVEEAYNRGLRHFGLLHDSDASVPLGDVYAIPPRIPHAFLTPLRCLFLILVSLAPLAEAQQVNFRITPLRPVEELRAEALKSQAPKEEGTFREPDLVELVKLDPTIKLDIRYATTNNFLSTPVYTQARAFLERPAARALVLANHQLRHQGYGLIIHDGYRPWYVTKIFWNATPDDKKNFVANPAEGSKHNRGCAVDLSLYDLKTGEEVQMPSGYDEMTDRAYADYPGGTADERARRALLREAMEKQGFKVIPDEWWHFDYKDWKLYPIINVKFEDLSQ